MEYHADVTEARHAYIGGSDWDDVFGGDPYGCRRRLWFEKTQLPPDFPDPANDAMRVGHALEEMVVSKWMAEAEADGLAVTVSDYDGERANDVPEWLGGHPDRMIIGDSRGVLEAKTAGSHAWHEFQRAGLPERYIWQMQAYMWLTGATWGYFAVLNRDTFQFRSFRVERSEKLIAKMRAAGEEFWEMVQNDILEGPKKLDSDDPRCQVCPFRQTCQHIYDAPEYEPMALPEQPTLVTSESDPELLAAVFDFDNVKARYNVVKAEYDAARAKVLEMLEARGQFYILPEDRDKPLKVVEAVTERLDTKRLREEMPDVAKKYTKTAIVRSLR